MNTAQIYELLTDFLDNIYYPGYTEDLFLNNPEAAYFELANFQKNYTS